MPHTLIALVVTLLLVTANADVKTLSKTCFCDVTSQCDAYCCCDQNCFASAITLWSNHNLCANDGFAIPFCSTYYNQPLHVHDLSQGLRIIYTIVKRLFCISKVNFATPEDSYQTTSTNSQLPNTLNTVIPAVNQKVLDLTPIAQYPALPLKNGLGLCAEAKIRDMNNINNENCLVYVASTSSITTVNLLNPSAFATANSFDPTKLLVYEMKSNSLTSGVTVSALTTSFACSVSGSTNKCTTIQQIRLFFIVGSTTTIDYTSSYLVIGPTYVDSPSYIKIHYSYQFIKSILDFPYPASKGYTIGSPLNLLLKTTSGSTTTYYKVFNPLNLAFRNLDGTCRASTDQADPNNLITLNFGVNSVYSCIGITSLIANNLPNIFNYIGSLGISSTNINDYVQLSIPIPINNNQNVQLIFYYAAIGTNLDPQYQILSAKLNGLGNTATNQPTSLFVEYQQLNTSILMNVPSPPVIDAYLPNDFLYPFYVA